MGTLWTDQQSSTSSSSNGKGIGYHEYPGKQAICDEVQIRCSTEEVPPEDKDGSRGHARYETSNNLRVLVIDKHELT
jgi:hypothetical protein